MNEKDVLKIVEDSYDIKIYQLIVAHCGTGYAESNKQKFLKDVYEKLLVLFDENDLSKF